MAQISIANKVTLRCQRHKSASTTFPLRKLFEPNFSGAKVSRSRYLGGYPGSRPQKLMSKDIWPIMVARFQNRHHHHGHGDGDGDGDADDDDDDGPEGTPLQPSVAIQVWSEASLGPKRRTVANFGVWKSGFPNKSVVNKIWSSHSHQ